MMRRIAMLFAAALIGVGGVAASGPMPSTTVAPLTPTADAEAPQLPESQSSGAREMTAQDVGAWLDGFMPYALQRGALAGAVVVVVKDGQVLAQEGYGYADTAKRVPVDPETTMFRLGSVSKPFTWTAVMQLVEAGKLDLDRDVNDYLDFTIPPFEGKPVTLRNIMTHTAGFEEALKGLITTGTSVASLESAIKRWVPQRIFAPGTTPAYSNYATALAGYIVQRASGQSFDDYVDANIFGRLGMTQSTFRQPLPGKYQDHMSKGYDVSPGEPQDYELIPAAPAGSLAASGADVAKFMIAHLNQGGPLLQPETARMMHRTYLDILPPLNRMALGFYETNRNGRVVIGHGGDTQLFHSDMSLFLDDNVGLFISINSSGKDGVTGELRNALLDQFADRYFPAERPKETPVDAETAKQHALMLAGNYQSSRRADSSFMRVLGLVGQIKVGVDAEGGVAMPFYGDLSGEPRKWVEIAPFVWRDANSNERLAAKVEDGRVVRFSIDGFAPTMMLDRIPWYLSSAWLLPALIAGMAVLALTLLFWPVGWIARRRYGAAFPLQGQARRVHLSVRILAGLALATFIGWAVAVGAMMSNLSLLSSAMDPVIILLQIASTLVFVALPAFAAWNVWLAWKGGRGWRSRVWSVLILLAAIPVLWVGVAFNLIGFGVNY